MPVKITHRLLTVVGGSQEQEAEKEGDGEVMQVFRKDVCVRERHLHRLDGGRSGLHRDFDKRDHMLSQILSVVCLHMFLFQ